VAMAAWAWFGWIWAPRTSLRPKARLRRRLNLLPSSRRHQNRIENSLGGGIRIVLAEADE
jgi:hypothetical protein